MKNALSGLLISVFVQTLAYADEMTQLMLSQEMCPCGCEKSVRLCLQTHPSCHQASQIREIAWGIVAEHELKNEMCSCGCERSISMCLNTHASCQVSRSRANTILTNIIFQ